MKQLIDIVRKLRSPEGCPWDREQDLESLKQYLLEECYELLEVMGGDDAEKHKDELGDVLLQVLLQSQIREELGSFTIDDVIRNLSEKLVRRHPHVFGDEKADTPKAVLKRWEEIKAAEKAGASGSTTDSLAVPDKSILDGIPKGLPALLKAQRIQTRASRVGFDWDDVGGVVAKIEEELGEVKEALSGGDPQRVSEELGDLLFAVVNLGRFRDISNEQALNDCTGRFIERFKIVANRVGDDGRKMADCSLAELEVHWQAAKRELGGEGNQ